MKILAFLSKNSNDGCTWYRLKVFERITKLLKNADIQYLDPTLTDDQLYQVLREADAYYIRLNDALPSIFKEFNLKNSPKPVILDMDDVYEHIDPLSDMYATLGTQEVKLTTREWLWKDKTKGFDIEENKQRVDKYLQLIKQATAVIVTTFELKQYVERYNKAVVVIPNCVDLSLFPVLPLKKDNTVTITWSGGASHYADLAEIKPVLKEIMEKDPRVYYHHVGQYFKGIIKDLPQSRVKLSGWMSPDGHGFRLASLNADIGIAPLRDTEFNTYKSSIKYYEYSALKIPTLARNMAPYNNDIIDGVNGFLYSTPEEFKQKLELLINDPLLRQQVGQAAYDYVSSKRNALEITKDWIEFFEGTAALCKKNVLRGENKPYVISTPPYNQVSGGVKVLHLLCNELNKRGQKAYITTTVTNPEYNTPYYKDLNISNKDWIAVYPETITGNPLEVPTVARWILNNAGKLGGDKTYGPNEILFAFSQMFNDFNLPEDRILLYPFLDTDLYQDLGKKRTQDCVYIGKGIDLHLKETEGLLHITREMSGDHKKLARIFQTSKLLYSYDNITAVTEAARLCGCAVVIIPNGEYTKEQYNKHELGWDGLGWGVGERQKAIDSLDSSKFREKYLALKDTFNKRLDNFIKITQNGNSNHIN